MQLTLDFQNAQKTHNHFRYVNGKKMRVNKKNILDEYFTKPEIAGSLYKKAKEIISKFENNITDYIWLEPSVGNGAFYNLLPENNRIGIDINPRINGIINKNYLDFEIPDNKKIIVIGNPPFGHRGVTALNFINHSKNAEFVCFILPMFFESKGKGSIKYRVKGFNLIHSERLPKNSFETPDNKNIDVKCVFQIWSKNHKIDTNEFNWYKNRKNEPFSDILKVYTVSLAKNRECGKKWIYDEKADFYLSSTFHKNTKVVYSFDEVKYKSGVAIVFTTKDKKIKDKVKKIFEATDWTKYASLATNSCYHIGKSNIFDVLNDKLKKYKNENQ